jgi:hypothetical protein
LGTDSGWAQRIALVEQLLERTMCELVEANRKGSGPGVPSLAVILPIDPPTVRISQRDDAQLATWRTRAAGAAARISLFDDPSSEKPPFEVVPWRFQYQYRCASPTCRGHEQTIVDWEILVLWRHVPASRTGRTKLPRRFSVDLWEGRDTALFVGNQEQHPSSTRSASSSSVCSGRRLAPSKECSTYDPPVGQAPAAGAHFHRVRPYLPRWV